MIFPFSGEPVPSHGLYLGVVQIDHSDAGTNARIMVKVFTNDLEDVIRAAHPETFERGSTETFCDRNRDPIEAYFRENLQCQINGVLKELKFLEGSQKNDVFWLQFELQAPEQWETISVRASFFMEIFSDQSNIVQVINGTDKRFARLTKAASLAEFTF